MAERPQKQLTVERERNVVTFRLTLPDDYAAIALYDASIAELNNAGRLTLSVSDATPAEEQ